MKINYQPDIFDDAEYCEDRKTEEMCKYLFYFYQYEEERCTLFADPGNPKSLAYDIEDVQWLKCEECLKHYNRAKPPKELPEGHRLG
jgi:hypothetical protein